MSELITPEGKIQMTPELYRECMRFIEVQARVAFSKANRNSILEIEDYKSVGLEEFEIAKEKWKPDGGSKFTTYFTLLLKNRLYKLVRSTHQKKRGGGGCKQDEVRFGHTERWENGEAQKSVAVVVSIDKQGDEDADHNGSTNLQIAAPDDNSVEYELLLEQVGNLVPDHLRNIFKQMVDPDEELLQLAVTKYQGEKKCRVDNELMAEYLKLDMAKLRSYQKQVQQIVAEHLGR